MGETRVLLSRACALDRSARGKRRTPPKEYLSGEPFILPSGSVLSNFNEFVMALLPEVLFGITLNTWLSVVFPIFLVTYWVGWLVHVRTIHPLASVPGPFWASISRTWLMYRMYVGDLEIVQRALHEQYGPLIRIAPDEVVSNDPGAIQLIFPIQKALEKTNWYPVWRPVPHIAQRADMFTSTNEKEHSAYRRIVGGVYAMSSILKNEDELDACVNLFVKRIGEFADRKEAFDFGTWLEM